MAIVRITLTAAFRGMTVQNVLHFDNHDSGILPTTHCATIRDQWMDEYKFFSVNQVIWINIAYTPLTPALGVTTNLAINIAGASNATDSRDHPVISEKIRIQTATAGRAGRGRIYAPVASLFGGNVGVVEAATITARNARLATLMSRFGGPSPSTGLTLGIAPRGNPGNFKPATSMFLASTYGIQRRRNIGVGI